VVVKLWTENITVERTGGVIDDAINVAVYTMNTAGNKIQTVDVYAQTPKYLQGYELPAPAAASTSNESAAVAGITATFDRHVQGISTQNITLLMADYADDAIVVQYDGCSGIKSQIQGKEAIAQFLREFIQTFNHWTTTLKTDFATVPQPQIEITASQVNLLWVAPTAGVESEFDTFLFDEQYKIRRQNTAIQWRCPSRATLGCGPGTEFDDSTGSCLITCPEASQGRNLLADLSPCKEKAAGAYCANAPSAYVAKINITFLLAGDASSFDSTSFKTALASKLSGVSSADIELNISASSVKVIAVITPPSTSTATAAFADLQQLATRPLADISRALGVTVQVITTPTYKLIPAASPPPPPLRRSLVLGIVLPVVLVGVSMLVLAIFLRSSRKTRKAAKGGEYLGQLELHSGISDQVTSPPGSSMKTSLVKRAEPAAHSAI